LKADNRKVVGVFDADWANSTPDLEESEKIKLDDIDTSWVDIEDLIPKEYFKKIFKELKVEFSIPFQYRTTLGGPGRGKKIKDYLRRKETALGKARNSLVNYAEIKMIDYVKEISLSEEGLPESFYRLNLKIIETIS
jgi:hypothetical protein